MSKFCPNCGGEARKLSSGEYECLCCGNVFQDAALAQAVTEGSVNATSSVSGADIYEKNINGILEISWSAGGIRCSGSGFLVSRDGYCITNTHVVTSENGRSCGTVTVKIGNETLSASVVALGDRYHGLGTGVDLALLKLSKMPSSAKVLEFEDFGNVRIGEPVFVIGNSLGYGTCITSGIVSDKERNVNGKMLLMTDCAVNGGNSGGPIFNQRGHVIGAIVSGITKAERMNFAIPSSTVMAFLRQCKRM